MLLRRRCRVAGEPKDTEKARRIVALLAGENCGECGFQNCGRFAVALVEGKASPAGCRKSAGNLNEICKVLGVEVPERVIPLPQGRRSHHHRSYSHRSHHAHVYKPVYGRRRMGHHHAGWLKIWPGTLAYDERLTKVHHHR